MKPYTVTLALLAIGCASNSGVRQIGPDTFMVSRQAATGFSGLGTLKADALWEASQFCSLMNKTVQLKNQTESQPPYILGNFPRAEIEFACTDSNDKIPPAPKVRGQASESP